VSNAELMFVVATGAEMDPYYMPRLIEFMTNLTRSLPVDSGQVRIGVITYGLEAFIDISLGQYTSSSQLIAAYSNLTYHGTRYYVHFTTTTTNMAAGRQRPRQRFCSGGVRKRVWGRIFESS